MDDILEGILHETSIASLVAVQPRAVNELLFRVRSDGLRLVVDEVEAFESTGGGESPARTALSLVLDRGDGTGGDPVDLS